MQRLQRRVLGENQILIIAALAETAQIFSREGVERGDVFGIFSNAVFKEPHDQRMPLVRRHRLGCNRRGSDRRSRGIGCIRRPNIARPQTDRNGQNPETD